MIETRVVLINGYNQIAEEEGAPELPLDVSDQELEKATEVLIQYWEGTVASSMYRRFYLKWKAENED